MRNQTNSRRASKSWNRSRALESLESRTLFSTNVPLPPPTQHVTDVEFSFENAPHELRFTFDQDVSAMLDTRDLLLTNNLNRFVLTGDAMDMKYDQQTNSAIFRFTGMPDGILTDGIWTATLNLAGAPNPTIVPGLRVKAPYQTEGSGQTALGRNLTPIEAPYQTEGNGSGQGEDGNFRFIFEYLRGDATHDGIVDNADFTILAANYGQSNRTFSQGDFSYDGVVDQADYDILVSQFGINLHGPMTTEGGPSCGDPAGWGAPRTELPALLE